MRTNVWFDCVDDDRPSIKFTDTIEAGAIVIPSIGEKVGIWPSPGQPEGSKAMQLHNVVDVRHFITDADDTGRLQEIHILLSERR
jgi:hypothetical protein